MKRRIKGTTGHKQKKEENNSEGREGEREEVDTKGEITLASEL